MKYAAATEGLIATLSAGVRVSDGRSATRPDGAPERASPSMLPGMLRVQGMAGTVLDPGIGQHPRR